VLDDVDQVTIDGLQAQSWPGAAALVRMATVRNALVRGAASRSAITTFLRVEGAGSQDIVLEENDLGNVATIVDRAPEVTPHAVQTRE